MRLPFKHNVRVEPDKQLIITMGNHNGGSGPWVKLNISPKEALFMAHNMEKALEAGFYAPMDSCAFCGEEFTKTKEILMLDEERFVHSRCFDKEHENKGLTYSDIKDWRRWFPHDAPKFEYSNLESRFDRIKYAVQVVSKTVIHLYVRPAGASTNKHFKLKNRVVLYCDELGTMPPFDILPLFSAGRSRKLTLVPIIQSLAQLEKNYGKEGAEIVTDNCQDTIFGGFAPNSQTAEVLSKALGERTVMSGSVSKGKDSPSQSIQMMGRPLMTPDELKSIPKGHFVVMKTGTHPMRTRLHLFLDWGITFGDPYILPEKAARAVAYASRGELVQAITDEQIQKQQQKQKAVEKEEKKSGGAGMQGQGEQVLDSSEKKEEKSEFYNTQKSEDRL